MCIRDSSRGAIQAQARAGRCAECVGDLDEVAVRVDTIRAIRKQGVQARLVRWQTQCVLQLLGQCTQHATAFLLVDGRHDPENVRHALQVAHGKPATIRKMGKVRAAYGDAIE